MKNLVTLTDEKLVAEFIDRARTAQKKFEDFNQEQVDDVVTGVAYAGYKNAEALAKLAVEETGLGKYDDKVAKNRRKTLGTLRDLKGARSMGVIHVDEERGITEFAKPVGVVAAITPVTNPGATVINNILITLKGRNAVILAPHPKGERTCAEAVRLAHEEMAKLGAPLDLVQLFSLKAADKRQSKLRAQQLMGEVDIVLVTGGAANVKAAYSSGTPALGVGRGNVPVIIDATADIADAANKVVRSKTFDHATSCSSENSLLIDERVYDEMMRALVDRGGLLLSSQQKALLQNAMWKDGLLSRDVVAQSPQAIAELAGIDNDKAEEAKFLLVEEEGIGEDYPFSGEKICPVLTLYKFTHFMEAVERVNRILDYQGKGHSCGIHSKTEEHIIQLAERTKVCRVLVNQAHCIGNGGDFANGLHFTLSMGAGTWGGNSTCDNITYKHFLNITRLAREIPAAVPTEEELWGDYLKRYGG